VWQLIETVPKDERYILLYFPTLGVCIAKYRPFSESWLIKEGRAYYMHDERPTHWMPLPEPPEEK
jgi:hypothetical protein